MAFFFCFYCKFIVNYFEFFTRTLLIYLLTLNQERLMDQKNNLFFELKFQFLYLVFLFLELFD